jgi:hypothetical protein
VRYIKKNEEGLDVASTISFRINKDSTFYDIMEISCAYMDIDKKNFEIDDDRYNALNPHENITEYFKINGIKENSTMVLIK